MSDQHSNAAQEKPEPIDARTSWTTAEDAQKTQAKIRAKIMAAPTAKPSTMRNNRSGMEPTRSNYPGLAPLNYNDDRYQSRPSPWDIFSDADKTPTEHIRWVIQDWLPNGELTLLVGAPNVGKNTVAVTIAAAISRGRDFELWPGTTPTGYGFSIMSSTEENFAGVSKSKFSAAGGNSRYFKKLNGIPSHHPTVPFCTRRCDFSENDNAIWQEEARKIEHLGMIIFDPASQVTRGSSSSAKDREGHEKLGRFAKDLDTAVIGIAHTAKTTKGKDIYARIAGTGAVGQVARSIIMIAKITGAPTSDGATHVMVLAKAYGEPVNYGVTFSIVGCEIADENGLSIKTSKIVWHGTIPGTPEDLLDWADGSGDMVVAGKPDPVSEAVSFLERILLEGPMPCSEAKELMAKAGITTRDRDRAKKQLGVVYYKGKAEGQFSAFYWCLPGGYSR